MFVLDFYSTQKLSKSTLSKISEFRVIRIYYDSMQDKKWMNYMGLYSQIIKRQHTELIKLLLLVDWKGLVHFKAFPVISWLKSLKNIWKWTKKEKALKWTKKVEKRLKKKVSTSFRVRAAPESWSKYTTPVCVSVCKVWHQRDFAPCTYPPN